MEILSNLQAFIIVLGIIIFVHEFGHFITAKAFGMRVFIFSFGFGRRLLGFKWGDTDCRLSLIPLGGYVKLEGEADDHLSEDVSARGDGRDFTSRPRWQRFLVYVAGPVDERGPHDLGDDRLPHEGLRRRSGALRPTHHRRRGGRFSRGSGRPPPGRRDQGHRRRPGVDVGGGALQDLDPPRHHGPAPHPSRRARKRRGGAFHLDRAGEGGEDRRRAPGAGREPQPRGAGRAGRAEGG